MEALILSESRPVSSGKTENARSGFSLKPSIWKRPKFSYSVQFAVTIHPQKFQRCLVERWQFSFLLEH